MIGVSFFAKTPCNFQDTKKRRLLLPAFFGALIVQ